MLYQVYQAHADMMVPARTWAGMAHHAIGSLNGAGGPVLRNFAAAYELIARGSTFSPR